MQTHYKLQTLCTSYTTTYNGSCVQADSFVSARQYDVKRCITEIWKCEQLAMTAAQLACGEVCKLSAGHGCIFSRPVCITEHCFLSTLTENHVATKHTIRTREIMLYPGAIAARCGYAITDKQYIIAQPYSALLQDRAQLT